MRYSSRLFLFLICTFLFNQILNAQQHPGPLTIPPDSPEWLRMITGENPNVFAIQKAYQDYFSKHPFEKNTWTQYYKRWSAWARQYTDIDGSIHIPDTAEMKALEERLWATRNHNDQNKGGSAGNWSFLGPKQTFHTDGATEVTWQTNIYSIDIAPSSPNILYAGGESGGLWKTVNKGLTWTLLTKNIKHGAFGAVRIHPANPDIVYATTGGKVIKTVDGGTSWSTVYSENNLWGNDIYIHASNPDIVLVACDQGLLRTVNGGANWVKLFNHQTWTVKARVGAPNTVYCGRKNGTGSDFMISTDGGATFNPSNTGWWTPGTGESVTGILIALCPSNPSALYAYLCGQGQSGNDNLKGYIGVFKSTDGGATWANTHPDNAVGNTPIAYSIPAHTNLMTHNGVYSGFDQGFYDMAIVVNPYDENELIAGGTSWFKSVDGGETWTALGSYVGGLAWSHPDIQALAAFDGDLWIASDGGLNYSSDFAQTMEARMNGISGADLWGFDSGWNEDVLVGGRYHNGNMAWHQSFPEGKYYRMGGAESPTGYVNPGENRKLYFSDIDGKYLNPGFGGGVNGFSVGLFPNESYAYYANSEMAWDPRCWNILYLGFENGIWKSTDGGASFTLLHLFPGNTDNKVFEVEVCRSNPDVLYCSQWDGVDDSMWKSVDGGLNWTKLTALPLPNNNDRVKMAVSAENENILWVAVSYGSNGKKIYKSINGGQSWTNLTTATLNNFIITNIMAQYGTDGGVYIGTNGGVFYRNNTHSDWQPFSDGLPLSAETNRLKPFYRDGKIRNGCWGFGVWESPLFEASSVIAQPMTSALETNCARDTVYFDDYSVVNHAGASWNWSFSPTPQYVSTTAMRNPKVVFGSAGTYTATMTLNGTFQKSLTITVGDACAPDTIAGNTLSLDGSDAFAVANQNLNLNSNTVTLTAWVKRDGAQTDFAGIVFARGGSTTAGLSITANNTLRYHWNDGQWWWNPAATVPNNQWTHVALVITPSNATIYLNGKAFVNTANHNIEEFNTPIKIGYDNGTRYFKGKIDEVTVWNKALTQAEIRELMHLTLEPSQHPELKTYYQFNEDDGPVMDRVATRHASMVADAARTTSTGPFGKGVSFRQNVSAGGTYAFGGTGVTLEFPASGTWPGGELCVSKINPNPDQLPNTSPHSKGYWVINNFGTNTNFSTLNAVTLTFGNIPNTATASSFQLFKRGSFADGNSWGNAVDQGDAYTAGTNGTVTFASGNGINSFSQFIVTYDGTLPVEWSDFQVALEDDRRVRLYWSVFQTGDVREYVVERSADGVKFDPIGSVAAKPSLGQYAYQALDPAPVKGMNYYRLKIVHDDGEIAYSVQRSILFDALAKGWVVFPNPLSKGQSLQVKTQSEEAYRLRFFDATGKIILEKDAEGNLNLPLDWSKGVYWYEIQSAREKTGGRLVIE